MHKLFDSVKMGDLTLANRIIMAPLTRCRASQGRVANQLMAEYYQQRASAGLMISEATCVDEYGVGYPDTPGIWSEQQIAGWQQVTSSVHKKNGKIFLQLWHVGRVSHPDFLNGQTPVAPSAVKPAGHVSLLRPQREYVTPRALELDEISQIIEQYRQAAINAKLANFDGVEIHAANGYLIDQFLQDSTNLRSDKYGGSVQNRSRLLLQITDACIEVWGEQRVGVHLAPRGDAHDMGDSNPLATFSYVAKELNLRNIAFVFIRESQAEPRIFPAIRQEYHGFLIANEGLDLTSAENLLSSNQADAVAFGRDFISNADLVFRLQNKLPLNPLDVKTMYGYGLADQRMGYVDYPFAK